MACQSSYTWEYRFYFDKLTNTETLFAFGFYFEYKGNIKLRIGNFQWKLLKCWKYNG